MSSFPQYGGSIGREQERGKCNIKMNTVRKALMTAAFVAVQHATWAAVTGRMAGTITDPSGGALPGALISIVNSSQGIKTKATAGTKGDYSFPSLPVGTYDVLFEAKGFRSEKLTGLVMTPTPQLSRTTLQLPKDLRRSSSPNRRGSSSRLRTPVGRGGVSR